LVVHVWVVLVVLVKRMSELLGAEPTRTTYSVAPLTAFQANVTTVLCVLTTRRFVGTHEACDGCGCDEGVDGVDEGAVGVELTSSAPPHAPVIAAASTMDNTPARFIPALLHTRSRSVTAADKIRKGQ
jgi:hypothetical protein